MIIVLKLSVVLLLMVFLLHRKSGIGNAMLAASLFLYLLTSGNPSDLSVAVKNTLSNPGTWNLIITLYLVMCLEYLLRTSGILSDFAASARNIFGSDRILLGFMPAFLGLLPSLGGAIFSAPLVKDSGEKYGLSPEHSSTINYWFRHIWEFTNPILPALLLASELTNIKIGTLIGHQFVFTLAAIVLGASFLLTGKTFKQTEDKKEENNQDDKKKTSYRSILLAAGPIIVNVLLVLFLDLNTAAAMGLVMVGFLIILHLGKKEIKSMLIASFDYKIQWGIVNILFFQKMLASTGTIDQIIYVFENSGIPIEAIVGLTAFTVGFLTGGPQGFVAVSFPIIAAVSPGNLELIAVGYVTGIAGTMSSPAHLCLLVTIEYFQADFFKTLLPTILLEILMIAFVYAYITIF